MGQRRAYYEKHTVEPATGRRAPSDPLLITLRVSQHRQLILSLIALFAIAAVVFVLKLSEKMPDFEVYWRAASHALAGEPLYRPEDGHWLFKYLPVFAVLMIPIALVPLTVAKAIWFFALLVALILLLRLCLQLLPDRRHADWLLVVGTTVVMGKFYGRELWLGQTNLLLTAAVAGAVVAMKQGREVVAGLFVAIAIVLKPYAVILLPWLVVRRRVGSVASAAVGLLVALALPMIRYGYDITVQLHLDWWQTVINSIEPNVLNLNNVSWLAMYSRWLEPGPAAQALATATTIAAAGLVVYVVWLRRRVAFPELLEAGLLLTLIPLMSPQGWDYTLLLATPAVMCLVNYSDQLPRALRIATITALAVVGLTIYDVLGRATFTAFMAQSGITLAFFVIIAALVTLRQRRVA